MDRVLELFADILAYPSDDVARRAGECRDAADAAGLPTADLDEFRRSVEHLPRGRLEEIYTAVFDLGAGASPYIGWHLFGDGYQRSMFLVELQKRYRRIGHETGRELADHLCVVLRFLSACDDAQEKEVLIREAVLPALASMVEKSGTGQSDAGPYRAALGALQSALEGG